jgi:hypothetical protein
MLLNTVSKRRRTVLRECVNKLLKITKEATLELGILVGQPAAEKPHRTPIRILTKSITIT